MSDRLNELRRQRELVEEHLAWLDREIAAASGLKTAPTATPSPAAPAPATPVAAPPALPTPVLATPAVAKPAAPPANASMPDAPPVEAVAESILADYRVKPDSMKSDVKKGCVLYFFAALAFVAAVVVGLYFLFQRGK